MSEIKKPESPSESVVCLHCNVVSVHEWQIAKKGDLANYNSKVYTDASFKVENLWISLCANSKCKKFSVWHEDTLIYPMAAPAPRIIIEPSEHMSEDVRKLYQEALDVKERSSRAAAVLIRVALEQYLKEKTASGKSSPGTTLEAMFQALCRDYNVKKSIADRFRAIQQIGSHAAHPSNVLNLDENETYVDLMFELMNDIVELMNKEEIIKNIPKELKKNPENPGIKNNLITTENQPTT